jgi:hypothetical protein
MEAFINLLSPLFILAQLVVSLFDLLAQPLNLLLHLSLIILLIVSVCLNLLTTTCLHWYHVDSESIKPFNFLSALSKFILGSLNLEHELISFGAEGIEIMTKLVQCLLVLKVCSTSCLVLLQKAI